MKKIIMLCLLVLPVIAWSADKSLAPGDIIHISQPGEPDLEQTLQIDKDGNIFLPEAGYVKVADMSEEKARVKIKNSLEKYFHDLQDLKLTVKEHRLIINVEGDVTQAGPVNLPADADIQAALNAAGGPLPGAQLDRIQIRRSGQTITFNYKPYLANGDDASLPKLRSLDTIFVPASPLKAANRASIRILGAVSKPGQYQWTEGLNLLDLIYNAGGATSTANLKQVKILSNQDGKAKKKKAFNLEKVINTGENFHKIPNVQPGSTIIVPTQNSSARDDVRDYVTDDSIYMFGSIGRPGRYPYKESQTFLDLLSAAGGPPPNADLRRITILHRNDGKPEVSEFNLARYFKTGDAMSLPKVMPGDTIYFHSLAGTGTGLQENQKQSIRLIGAVGRPGMYSFDQSMTILDLFAQAGGVTGNAYLEKIVILNMSCCDGQTREFDMKEFLVTGDISTLPTLREGDTIFVPDQSQSNWQVFLRTIGEVSTVLTFLVLILAL